MSSIRRSRPLRAALGLVLIAALAFGITLLVSPSAQAMPDVEVLYIYFSDATKTEIVGTRHWTCEGLRAWGEVTEHYDRSEGRDCPNYYCKETPYGTECGYY